MQNPNNQLNIIFTDQWRERATSAIFNIDMQRMCFEYK